jgi:hypothetical protein
MRPSGWENPWQKPLRVWLNPSHGPALQALPFDLVWCTTWAAEANEWIGPHLGLPELPVIDWPDEARKERPDRVFWKTAYVVESAAGRPFAWIDDDFTDRDREYVTAHHNGAALLHWVSPRLGLLGPDFQALAGWAADLDSQAA